MENQMHPFEQILSVTVEDIELLQSNTPTLAWMDFWLNPRRLRGSDFLMRWSQGRWSEERITHTVNQQGEFFVLPYGPSGTAPDNDVRAFELYFERLEAAGLGSIKRPDLLIFHQKDKELIESVVDSIGGIMELPFIPEDDSTIQTLLPKALVAIECENSLWQAELMPDYNAELRPQKRLDGKLGLKKNAVLPTIILKEEDRQPLQAWQNKHHIPIHIWHLFFDRAFGISFDEIQRLINGGYIQATEQTFQAPSGATTQKLLYKIYHHYAYSLAHAIETPQLVAKSITDKNGHILPYVHFEGGTMQLDEETLIILRGLRRG